MGKSSKHKMTRQQREAKIEQAKQREAAIKAQKERSERIKKIFTVVICAILVLALGIPTMAIAVLGM
ncbi:MULTISPECIES: CASC3 protein CASC3 [unclassified Adlercreutzia]|uniref:CASC3 protein CASC3 n=1 Tax=unclassified Adlercreutzia TaxID=2636013 RepID=UPI0013EDD7D1|nr:MULTISPECIES: CASC3 protein CASC3 [unclassified Adlercreutzia]